MKTKQELNLLILIVVVGTTLALYGLGQQLRAETLSLSDLGLSLVKLIIWAVMSYIISDEAKKS